MSDSATVFASLSQRELDNTTLNKLALSGRAVQLYSAQTAQKTTEKLSRQSAWSVVSEQIKDAAGHDSLDDALAHQKAGLHTPEQQAIHLATSIKQGTVTASLMLKKLASYPKQNGLAKALREIGRIERTLFMLDWFRDPALRRRVQAGLNKGEARNALARAVFMHRLGEIRDRKPENQSYRASGLTLLTAAISLWNTVYMERAIDALKRKGLKINEQLLSHLSPLGWEHINLTGDYIWKSNRIPASGKFRRLRPAKVERSKNNLNVQ